MKNNYTKPIPYEYFMGKYLLLPPNLNEEFHGDEGLNGDEE